MTSSSTQGGAFKALRFAGLVAVAGLGVAIFLVTGSYLIWQSETKSNSVSQRNLQELRSRLENAKRELADLQGSEETYKNLIARGAFAPERRIDFIEAMAELKKRHNILGLEYEVAPQRPLRVASGAGYAAVGIMASRIRMKIQTYHDGDLMAFLDEFPRIQRGFFPIDKCTITRVGGPEVRVQAPIVTGAPSVTRSTSPANVAAIEADCALEWITLVDKSKPANIQAAVEARKPI